MSVNVLVRLYLETVSGAIIGSEKLEARCASSHKCASFEANGYNCSRRECWKL